MKKTTAGILAGSAGFLLLIGMLYCAVASIAFSIETYRRSPPPFDEMADALVSYLTGGREDLPAELFTEQERLHMVDVYHLFKGAKTLAAGAALVGVLCLGLAVWLGGATNAFASLMKGITAFWCLALLVGIWAAVDFNGWFTFMHEIVFTNDLWLLDPNESFLIQMMTLDFFVECVIRIGARFALWTALLAGVALLVKKRKRKDAV